MKYKLTLLDRLALPTVFPEKANRVTHKIAIDVTNKTELQQDDFVKYKITALENGSLSWPIENNKVLFEYDFTELELTEIKKFLTELDSKNQLTKSQAGLSNIFLI